MKNGVLDSLCTILKVNDFQSVKEGFIVVLRVTRLGTSENGIASALLHSFSMRYEGSRARTDSTLSVYFLFLSKS